MALTGLLHRLGHFFTHHEAALPCPPEPPRQAGSRAAEAQPAPHDFDSHDTDCWEYLIASSSTLGDRLCWTLMGPPTGVDVDGDATPELVASALGRQGWRMVTTSPPAPTHEGTINYIFRRPTLDHVPS